MAYPLLGTKIVIDEEKVLREKKYKLDVIYEYLDKLAEQCNLMKTIWQIWDYLCADMQ